MKVWKQRLHNTIDSFFKIATGICIVSAIYISLFWGTDTQLAVAPFLGQILLTAVLCSAVSLFIGYEQEMSKKSMFIRIVIHYVYENIVVLGCGIVFEWFYLSNWKMLLGMVIAIAVVFFGIVGLCYRSDYKTAQKMNEKLMER